ncbi:Oidioi.mRNA.OKI2018_I69.chr2.g7748.t1.cds [Oikopleura dioica]|uniref:Oidioi.mRNA.OKI2018_I69.chr2.g7748.t1.cds n=1 Tax=Oikopleura dioica TaxID=34765 RepID=A0ABN7T7Q2_OIKDI|nr:Oidioi.mRNA.OKI2018_I69.chr2.g7748.t1.cds [Oikopleura dioica]
MDYEPIDLDYRRIPKVPPVEPHLAELESHQMAAHKTEVIMEFVTRSPGEDKILKMKLPIEFNNEHHTLRKVFFNSSFIKNSYNILKIRESWEFAPEPSEFEDLDPQLLESDYYQGNQMIGGVVVDTFLIAFASAPDGKYTLTVSQVQK